VNISNSAINSIFHSGLNRTSFVPETKIIKRERFTVECGTALVLLWYRGTMALSCPKIGTLFFKITLNKVHTKMLFSLKSSSENLNIISFMWIKPVLNIGISFVSPPIV
jgi:hypothetical protein